MYCIIVNVIYILLIHGFWIESFTKLPNAALSSKQVNYEIMQQLPTKGSCKLRLSGFQTLYICVVTIRRFRVDIEL